MEKFLWDKDKGMWFDYDTVKKKQTTHENVTTFWPLWAGVVTPKQAVDMVSKALPSFESMGGILPFPKNSESKDKSKPDISQIKRSYSQPLHQMIVWLGLTRYGFTEEAERLAYKWLYLITKTFVDSNGKLAEEYNVSSAGDAKHDGEGSRPKLRSIADYG